MRAPTGQLRLAIAAASLCVLVVALLAAGGAPESATLFGASLPVSWAVPVLRLAADGAAIACCGAVLAAAAFVPSGDGMLGKQGLRAMQDAAVAAAVWAVATIGGMVTTASVVLGVPLLELPQQAGAAGEFTQVRALAVVVVLTAALAVVASGTRTVATAQLCFVLIAAALIGPLLTGHAAHNGVTIWATLATGSLVVHVAAATVWVGGLWAVIRYSRERAAVERFSRIALICAVAIGVTGLLTAEIHLGGREDGWGLITQWVTTGYGVLVFAKAVAFAGLVGIGWWHRRATLPALAQRPALFYRLAAVELLVMAGTVGLAVALSRTP
ncbi:hypothetical protein Kfla_5749 [Kribbella flavida DSM 17836]|uniref:Copper resistance protein D domain-containing protein n=1 Tax=Kribbella flavida (strain DSM 17836 / JCM 10339 / NBRC 14399) TaxID=479435 RepID=D2PQ52_KRIFD|nr:CopD family protein [Kribbella flavida]ADB34754.1 hypothetical protein Kfla_5749 [Kribbella flavida DSM 17836]